MIRSHDEILHALITIEATLSLIFLGTHLDIEGKRPGRLERITSQLTDFAYALTWVLSLQDQEHRKRAIGRFEQQISIFQEGLKAFDLHHLVDNEINRIKASMQ